MFDHRRGNGFGGHVSEHGHAEVLIVQIGMAPSGFLNRRVQLEVLRIPANSRQWQPPKKRRSACDHRLMTGIRPASASGIIGYRWPYAPSETNMIFTSPWCQMAIIRSVSSAVGEVAGPRRVIVKAATTLPRRAAASASRPAASPAMKAPR